jgi:hypothetical protein
LGAGGVQMVKTGRSSDQFMLRLPDELRSKIKDVADRNGRSMNAEIVLRLERSIIFEDRYGPIEEIIKDIWGELESVRDSIDEIKDKIPNSRDFFSSDQGNLL